MPSIDTELKTYLKTKLAITDLIGAGDNARIYERVPRETATLPFIALLVFEGNSHEHLGGITGLARTRVQVDCYAGTAAESFALAELVRLAPLQGEGNFTMGTTDVRDVSSPNGYTNGDDPPYQGSEENLFWHSRDYFISHREPTA